MTDQEAKQRDSTGEHRIKLERAYSLLASVIESPEQIVIFSLDRNYCYTAFNTNHKKTMQQIWGVEIEVGMNMLQVIGDPADRIKARENFDRALDGERFVKVEEYGEHPNRFFYEDIYNPILDETEQVIGLTVFLTNITEKKLNQEKLETYRLRLEELVKQRTSALSEANVRLEKEIAERQKTEKLLIRAQRLESLGTLAGGVAHDFNNILTAIFGYSELLLEASEGTSKEHLGFLKEIQDSCERGANLTSQLISFSKRQVLQKQRLNLNQLVLNLRDFLRRLLPEDLEIEIDLDDALPLVEVDSGQIEQCIMNLVVNARDAMPNGGLLTIRTFLTPLGDEPGATAEGWVSLVVEDRGLGIPPEDLDHIFEPFFSTKSHTKGSGLGLSMVYGIVQQHGGEIHVDSEVGRGTLMQLNLPASDASAEIVLEASIQSALSKISPASGGILIVEDDPAVLLVAERICSQSGYTAFSASCVEEALRTFDENGHQIELLFTDVVLPDGDGIQLALKLTHLRPSLPVVFTSGYQNAKTDSTALHRIPFHRFLSKPYRSADVIGAFRELLHIP